MLAAGESRRFGRQKLLEPWRGEPLVRHAVRAFLDGGLQPVLVIVAQDGALGPALQDLQVGLVPNPHPELGVSHSIRLGVSALPAEAPAVAIGVGDQPFLTGETITRLCQAFRPGSIVAPRYGLSLGTPRLYDRRFFAELTALVGDTGGHVLAVRHPEAVIEVELPEALGADVDTAEDWRTLLGGGP